MAQYQKVFKRYEKKYLMDEQQYQALKKFLQGRMTVNQFGSNTICNIYFDTPDYRLIRASIEKPVYKEKLRLRSYGVPKKEDTVFVELKKKYKGIVYKRRVPMTLQETEQYLLRGKQPNKSGQILKEIGWFLDFYQPIIPKVYIAYDRIAMCSSENTELRITFDTNIRWRESILDLARGVWGNTLLEEGQHLMEIKILGSMPIWLSKGLTEIGIFPASYSKYGNCYKNYLIYSAEKRGIQSA
ncbi:VTC domain-containing protein [Desulfotomaculum arcticum]|uniref:VTC domain-containing protein n=1 Tax=Desulfotruncus arcticus DSM 17038 TaxID=1121424 RepID=A0A1I2W8A5_9FIRM|nr:polyphosphate polymerase domain-containing protein [Desulfotruncus arcticus]SFG97610.1 VTC domain-containing protein [Desulfotomaculum arcticum] [Desulfotruncus arcticus DSM 17038]